MSRQLLSELPWEDGDDIARVEDARQALGQPEEVFVVVVALIVIVLLMLMLTCYINKLARDISRLNARLDMVETRHAVELPLRGRGSPWSIASEAPAAEAKGRARAPRFDVQLLPARGAKEHLKTCMLVENTA